MSFPKLIFDAAHSMWSCEDTLGTWAGFQSRRGPYTSSDRDQPSDGAVHVSVQADADGVPDAKPSAAQEAAYTFLKANERAVSEAILAAVFARYPEAKAAYEEATDESWPRLPEITTARELRQVMGLAIVHVLTTAKDGMSYVGFELGCDWEEEHGLGVLAHGLDVVAVGHADVSFRSP
jgi:hypothetical protein